MTAIFLHTSWMNFTDQSRRRRMAKRVAALRQAPAALTAPVAADTSPQRQAPRVHRLRESVATLMRPLILSAGIRQPVTCRIFNVSNKRIAAARTTGGTVRHRRL